MKNITDLRKMLPSSFVHVASWAICACMSHFAIADDHDSTKVTRLTDTSKVNALVVKFVEAERGKQWRDCVDLIYLPDSVNKETIVTTVKVSDLASAAANQEDRHWIGNLKSLRIPYISFYEDKSRGSSCELDVVDADGEGRHFAMVLIKPSGAAEWKVAFCQGSRLKSVFHNAFLNRVSK